MSEEQIKYETERTPRQITFNTVGNETQTEEELWIKEVGEYWVIDNRFYFKPHKDEFEWFLHRAGYEEIVTDELPERVVTKYIKTDESRNAFAYFMKGEWKSIHEEIETHQNRINELNKLL